MNKSDTSASAWLSQTIFVTYSDDLELQLLNAKVQNVVSIKSQQMISMVNEYEKVSMKVVFCYCYFIL